MGHPQGSIVDEWIAGSQVAASFSSVSCVSVGACTAVGADGNGQPIYATETSGVWGTATELPASGSGSFSGVSCTDPTDCSAIGTSGGDALYSTESAGMWSAPTTMASDSGTAVVVTSLSCTRAGNCTAVGYESGGGGQGPGVYLTQTDGTWSAPTTLSVPGSPGSGPLYGVNCTDASDCTAVGDANPPDSGTGSGAPVYATEVGGTWGTPTVLSGTPDGTGELTGVSCVDESHCVAVGVDGNNEPIYTNSDAAVVPIVASVAPTVSSIRPERGSASGSTFRWSPFRMAFVPGRDLVIRQVRHQGASPATSPGRRQRLSQLGRTECAELTDPETTSEYPAFRLG